MSPTDPREPEPVALTDAELDRYLEGGTELSKAYRELRSEEPPGALDTAIRDAARRGRRAGPTFGGGWRVQAPLAAMVVLAVGIALWPEPEPPYPASHPESDAAGGFESSDRFSELEKGPASPSPGRDAGAAREQSDGRRSGIFPDHRIAPSSPPAPANDSRIAPPPDRVPEPGKSDGSTGGRHGLSGKVEQEPARSSSAPDNMVRHVERLLEQGRIDEARTVAGILRERFPAHPLPPAVERALGGEAKP